MKYFNHIIIALTLLLYPSILKAQDSPLEFSEVINAEGKTVAQIYPIVKSWIAISFKSANSVIQMDDKDNGMIICKGNFSYRAPGGSTYRCIDGAVDFTLKIQIRDGRYKVTLNDFTHKSLDIRWSKTWSFDIITNREKYKDSVLQDNRWKKTWPDLQFKCKEFSIKLFKDLNAATSGEKPVIDDENDW